MLTSRTLFTWKQKAELWERWKNGQSVLAISRGLERRNKTGVQRIVALHGGVAPAPRRRAVAALKLEEREEISRGIARPSLVAWYSIGSYDGSWRRSLRCNGRQSRSPVG